MIDVVLFCPQCKEQHIDRPETDAEYTERLFESPWWELGGYQPQRWTNPPHKSHTCHFCGCQWRPADVETNGVAKAKTRRMDDTWPVVSP